MTAQHWRVISLSDQGEDRPSIIADVPDEGEVDQYLVPYMTYEDLLWHWCQLEANDPNGEYQPHPALSDDGLVLTIHAVSGEPMEYLAEPDGRFRLDGLPWVEGDWSPTITKQMHEFGYLPPLECGCVPHRTRMTGMGFTCIAEDQGYCNFECPHEEGDD